MRYFVFIGALILSAPAMATSPNSVPEMDVGAGIAAIALLAGAAAIIREKSRKK
ncbi:hypothetical protein [Hyphococcus sp.]|uniref:hypothetical protein n=1 Tax=Hyphococcus sp. TaxID=2038636 RepID=UPI003CCBFE89